MISLPGLILCCAGLLLGLSDAIRTEQTHQMLIGETFLTSVLFFTGALMGFTGVTLHSLAHFATQIEEKLNDFSNSLQR